jgi:hypothetical protein
VTGAVVSTSVLLFPHTRNAQKENGPDQTGGACGGPFAWVSAGNCRSLEAGNIFVRGAKAREVPAAAGALGGVSSLGMDGTNAKTMTAGLFDD